MDKISSILGNFWRLNEFDERQSLMISQNHNISFLIAKLLNIRNITNENISNYLNPELMNNLNDPLKLLDMHKSIERTYKAITNEEKISVIGDYDVDGSTSVALLFRFFKHLNKEINIEIPNRLLDGYGPNHKTMKKVLKNKTSLLFTVDCGTSSFGILDHDEYNSIDTIVIDHHLSEKTFPKVYSIINPNRFDESNIYKDLAAVGVTFLFLLSLRKYLRSKDFFILKNIKEPNLLSYLDLVALGTICDVVHLSNYNRAFVKKGLQIIHKRKNIGIKQIIDNSIKNHSPTISDLGFIIGPQLNAASRIDDSSLPSKVLTSNNIVEVEIISKKLLLLNEKRKLIENTIYKESIKQLGHQLKNNVIIIKGKNWHKGVLGIVAGKLVNKFNKPVIIISFDNNLAFGSARSIKDIDVGNIIINLKKENLLLSGGGHKMAAGFKLSIDQISKFEKYLIKYFSNYDNNFFQKIDFYDSNIDLDQLNLDLIENIEKLEPFGNGNREPKFLIKDIFIEHAKIIKDKHVILFIKNNNNIQINAICFNCVDNNLGENFLKSKTKKFSIICNVKRDNYSNTFKPQLIIHDAFNIIN